MPPIVVKPPISLTEEERENVYKAMLGMKLSFDERLGDLNEEVKRVDVKVDGVGSKLDRLDGKYDALATDVREILQSELAKARGVGTLRGTLAGGGVSAVILALIPLIERLLG